MRHPTPCWVHINIADLTIVVVLTVLVAFVCQLLGDTRA